VPVLKFNLMWRAFFDTRPESLKGMIALADRVSKWSMLDVFVVAVFVVAISGSWLSEMRLGSGAYLFTASVILSMLAMGRIRALIAKRVRNGE